MNSRIALLSLPTLSVAMVLIYFQTKMGEEDKSDSIVKQSQMLMDQTELPEQTKETLAAEDETNSIEVDKSNQLTELATPIKSPALADQKVKPDKALLKQIDTVLNRSARDGNWTAFEAHADEAEQTIPELDYRFALFIAIKYDAPIEVFEALVAKGGKFDYRHLFMVAKLNRHKRYEDLKHLGLNVHLTDPKGVNALFVAMNSFEENQVFFYLLLDKVNPNLQVKGRDLIQICLEQILKTKVSNEEFFRDKQYWRAAAHFYRLIEYGNAKLLPNHLEMLRKIQAERPKTFELMIKDRFDIEVLL